MAHHHLPTYAILFFVSLISTVLLRTIISKIRRTKARFPPGPVGFPIIGHLHLLGPIPHRSLHKLSERYGPLLHLRLGSVPSIVASSVETAEEILKTQETSFASRRQPSAFRRLTYGSFDMAWAPYGPYWKFLKKLSVSELFSSRTLQHMLPVRREEIMRLLQVLLKKSEAGNAVDVGSELEKMTNNVISRMMMSGICTSTDGEADDVRKVVHEALELMGAANASDYIGFCRNLDLQGLRKRSEDAHCRFDRLVERIIKKHEKARKMNGGDGAKDILDILLDVSEDESAEVKLTRDNIKAFMLGIFVGGTDTSSITTEWALAELINHPDMLMKARAEIDSVVGKERLVEESDVHNLPYIQAIVKETFRLHPTIPLIVRECTNDCKIDGYDIPLNSQVFISVWAIGRDPEYWDGPLEFRPERFMPSDKESDQSWVDVRGQHFQLIPFGSGRRGCPGTNLALHVIHTTIALMVQCFDWKIGNGEENPVLDMTEGGGLALPRSQPLVCVPVARLNPFPSIG
ncbi:cytochrome P450 93A3-like [Magnolia sinica]|uniref:cytochrome P450 93A3-like n=1 Tax=Magnolia sinica TaxID=86752 RepID=UPI00265A87D2|nr:cytochrome P450 93A3-like [Magnolia sinica]